MATTKETRQQSVVHFLLTNDDFAEFLLYAFPRVSQALHNLDVIHGDIANTIRMI
jgi:hypothetical protein